MEPPYGVSEEEAAATYERNTVITAEQQEEAVTADQRTDSWAKYRLDRASASRICSFIGGYGKTDEERKYHQEECMAGMLHGNAVHTLLGRNTFAMQQGTKKEPRCEACCKDLLERMYGDTAESVTMLHEGSLISLSKPWVSASSDGLAIIKLIDGTAEVLNLEFKCPLGDYGGKVYPQYYAQMQMQMGVYYEEGRLQKLMKEEGVTKLVKGWKWRTLFCVYRDGVGLTQHNYVDFNPKWFRDVVEKAREIYMGDYVYRMALRDRGDLKPPLARPMATIALDVEDLHVDEELGAIPQIDTKTGWKRADPEEDDGSDLDV